MKPSHYAVLATTLLGASSACRKESKSAPSAPGGPHASQGAAGAPVVPGSTPADGPGSGGKGDGSGNATLDGRQIESCDVIVAGGSTAGLAAALGAAREFALSPNSVPGRVCLIEPTAWEGGQLTASGVSAVDFPHHVHRKTDGSGIDVGKLGRMTANHSRLLSQWLTTPGVFAPASQGSFGWDGNPGGCWVSVRCYLPKALLPLIAAELNRVRATLAVFRNTVVKSVEKNAKGEVVAVNAIARAAKSAAAAGVAQPDDEASAAAAREALVTKRLAQEIEDWYSPNASADSVKKLITFQRAGGTKTPVVIDATEWGEVMALGDAAYVQGVETDPTEASDSVNETCGQAIVFPVAIELRAGEVPLPPELEKSGSFDPDRYKSSYSLNDVDPGTGAVKRAYTFEQVWTYRRIAKGPGATGTSTPYVGDVSMQNWTAGNDYPFRYLFMTRGAARAQAGDWKGGIDLQALDEAEQHALGWFKFLRGAHPVHGKRLAPSRALGTSTGLARMPYMRDTRRSVGVDGFTLKYNGPQGIHAGHMFPDEAVAIGSYAADIHPGISPGCAMPEYVVKSSPTPAPFYIPLRALTNKTIPNLLVAGKTMAQSFLANAATRLHPIEFATGTAAGVAAVYLTQNNLSVHAVFANEDASVAAHRDIRKRLTDKSEGMVMHTPAWWTGILDVILPAP